MSTIIGASAKAQTTIAEWTYEPLQGAPATPVANTGSGTSLLVGAMATPGAATGMNTPTGCGAQTSGTNAWAIGNANPGAVNESSGAQFNVSTVGFEEIAVQWEQRWSGTATNTVRFQYTIDGSTWTNFDMTASNTTFCLGVLDNGRFETNTTTDQFRRIRVDLSAIPAVSNNANFGFRVVAAHYQTTGQFRRVNDPTTAATGGTWRFDNVRVQGSLPPGTIDPPVPSSLSGFLTTLGSPSASQTFAIAASNITAPLVVTAPTGFEVREDGVGAFGPSVDFAAAPSVTKTIEVRLIGDVVGFYFDDVTITSTGSGGQAVSVSGEVEAPAAATLNAGTLAAFGNLCINTLSAPLSFDLVGFNLTGDVTVGPLAGFTFSDDEFGTFAATLDITPDFGEVDQPVWVRFEPTTVQDFSGNIPVSGGGADAIDVAASAAGVNTLAAMVTGSATGITFSEATLAGTISDEGCSAIIAYGIEYSTTARFTPGSGTQEFSVNITGGSYTVDLSGLAQGTGYYYRAFATNAGGTGYGDEEVFFTLRPIITQWNFNSPIPDNNLATGTTVPSIGNGTASLVGVTATFASGAANGGSSDPAASDNTGWNTTNYAAQGEESGERGTQFLVSTLGFENIAVSWDLRTSNTSSRWQELQYTTDGTTWTPWPTKFENTGGDQWFNNRVVDLGSVTGANNNPDFGVRLVSIFAPSTSAYAAASTSYAPGGTWRFDMVTVSGVPLPPVPPTKLAITDVNGGAPVVVNELFSLTIESQDDDGLAQVVDADTEVTIAYVSGAGGNLGGTVTGSILENTNSVTISGITYDLVDAALEVSASVTAGPALTAATTTFPVVGSAVALEFVGFPATGFIGVPVTAFTVEARRADNSLAVDYAEDVTIALVNGTGTITGTLTQPAVAGVATFAGITFDENGSKELEATSGSLQEATASIAISTFTFGAGNLVVLQAEASANNTTASVLELQSSSNNATPLLTIEVPSTGANAIRISGSATSTGYVSRTDDRTLLTFNGHNSTTSNVNANTLNPRTVVTLTPDGQLDLATTYTGGSGNQTRGSTSLNNSDWFIADQGGLFTNDATSADPTGNLRAIKAFGGVVYVGRASTNAAIIEVSTVSAFTGGSITALPGITNNGNHQDFCLVQSGVNGDQYDVLYILSATSNTAGTIAKYSLVDGSWEDNGTFATGVGGFGLTAEATATGAFLYLTTGQGALAANQVLRLTDDAGYNAALDIDADNNLVVYTAPAGKILKGLDFAPQPCVPAEAVSTSSNSPICSNEDLLLNVTATGSGTLSYSWSGVGTFDPDNTSASVSVSGAETGTYSVTVTNACGSDVATVNVTVTPATTNTTTETACDSYTWAVNGQTYTQSGIYTQVDGCETEVLDLTILDCSACADVTLELNLDLSGSQTTWEITAVGSPTVLCSGGPYFDGFQLNITENCCLPEGCYNLRVFDSAGDGMVNGFNGGYQLRLSADNRRIIDNQRNGGFGSISEITGNAYSFCLPIGDVEPIFTSCDKYWWRSGEYLVATPDAAVSAVWVDGGANNVQSPTTGYEFWFYDPNGGYSFRRFRSHNISDGYGNVGATRTCHMRVNNWAVANHIPQFDLMNVRIRTRIFGVNGNWGPACRFIRNEALSQCPPTKLMDIPGNQFLSCGQFRQFVTNQRIHSRPISGASQYQWRFRIEAENVEIIRTSTTYFLNLGWAASVAPQLQAGKTYEVDVRAFRNGAWCIDPLDPDSAWGDVCLLTITSSAQAQSQNIAMAGDGGLNLWPNPNGGDQFWVTMEGIAEDVLTVAVDIHDLSGKRVMAREIPVNDRGMLNTVIDLNGNLANGAYLVSVIAGEQRFTQRLVIAD